MDRISDYDDSNRDNKFIRHILYSTQKPTRFGFYRLQFTLLLLSVVKMSDINKN